MSTSGINKSAILTQKLDALKRQGKKLHLIIAPPRSVSTAFTRALCHAGNADGVHEILHALEETQNNEGIYDVLNNIQPHKDNVIIKEMAQTDVGHPATYLKLLGIIMDKAEAPIIIITANPKTVFLSMMQVCAKNIIQNMQKNYNKDYPYPQQILTQFMTSYCQDTIENKKYTNHNIKQIEKFIKNNPEKFLLLNAHNIKTHPKEAIDAVRHTWFPETPPQEDLRLSPIVRKFTEQPNIFQKWMSAIKKYPPRDSEYLLSYDDRWTSEADQAKQYFEPHLQISEDINARTEKLKDFISNTLTSAFDNIQPQNIEKFKMRENIDDLMKTILSEIKPIFSQK